MIRNSTAEFLMFTADSRQDGLEVRFQDETVWLTQKMMAELFQCSSDNISLHLKNIFKNGELEEKSVTEEFSVTASDGKRYHTKHFNLDVILLDVMLPGGMNGFDVLEQLKKNSVSQTIPVFMLTNLDSEEKVAKTIGAKGYIVKANTSKNEIVKLVMDCLQ